MVSTVANESSRRADVLPWEDDDLVACAEAQQNNVRTHSEIDSTVRKFLQPGTAGLDTESSRMLRALGHYLVAALVLRSTQYPESDTCGRAPKRDARLPRAAIRVNHFVRLMRMLLKIARRRITFWLRREFSRPSILVDLRCVLVDLSAGGDSRLQHRDPYLSDLLNRAEVGVAVGDLLLLSLPLPSQSMRLKALAQMSANLQQDMHSLPIDIPGAISMVQQVLPRTVSIKVPAFLARTRRRRRVTYAYRPNSWDFRWRHNVLETRRATSQRLIRLSFFDGHGASSYVDTRDLDFPDFDVLGTVTPPERIGSLTLEARSERLQLPLRPAFPRDASTYGTASPHRLVYVASSFSGDQRVVSDSCLAFWQKRIINALCEMHFNGSPLPVIFKAHPKQPRESVALTDELMAALSLSRATILDTSIEKALEPGDILIADSPTTAFFDGLQAGFRCLFVDIGLVRTHDATGLLQIPRFAKCSVPLVSSNLAIQRLVSPHVERLLVASEYEAATRSKLSDFGPALTKTICDVASW